MKHNAVDADKELQEFLKNTGIEVTDKQKELLKRCQGYAQRLIDRGGPFGPIGVPFIGIPRTTEILAVKNHTKPTVIDVKSIYAARRNPVGIAATRKLKNERKNNGKKRIA